MIFPMLSLNTASVCNSSIYCSKWKWNWFFTQILYKNTKTVWHYKIYCRCQNGIVKPTDLKMFFGCGELGISNILLGKYGMWIIYNLSDNYTWDNFFQFVMMIAALSGDFVMPSII